MKATTIILDIMAALAAMKITMKNPTTANVLVTILLISKIRISQLVTRSVVGIVEDSLTEFERKYVVSNHLAIEEVDIHTRHPGNSSMKRY